MENKDIFVMNVEGRELRFEYNKMIAIRDIMRIKKKEWSANYGAFNSDLFPPEPNEVLEHEIKEYLNKKFQKSRIDIYIKKYATKDKYGHETMHYVCFNCGINYVVILGTGYIRKHQELCDRCRHYDIRPRAITTEEDRMLAYENGKVFKLCKDAEIKTYREQMYKFQNRQPTKEETERSLEALGEIFMKSKSFKDYVDNTFNKK